MDVKLPSIEESLEWSLIDTDTMYQERILQRDWEDMSLVSNIRYWSAKIKESNKPKFKAWCWISTILNAPLWEQLNDVHLEQWFDIWDYLYSSNLDDAVKKMQSSRWEMKWIERLHEAKFAQSLYPLVELQVDEHLNEDMYWRLLLITSRKYDWLDKLQELWFDSPPTQSKFMMQQIALALEPNIELPPPFWKDWMMDAVTKKYNVNFHPFKQTAWNDIMCNAVIVAAKDGHASLPHQASLLWNIIPQCSYACRLNMATAFMQTNPLEKGSLRWPLNYNEMREIIESTPATEFAEWGSESWLAGLLHIVPELAHLLAFQNLLPVTPESVISLLENHIFDKDIPSLDNTFDNSLFNIES